MVTDIQSGQPEKDKNAPILVGAPQTVVALRPSERW
jgi:hypothetical protein